MSNVQGVQAAGRSRGQQVVSMLLVVVVVAALVPGAGVLALTWFVKAVAAGWGPLLGGALFACTWPFLDRAWRELTGRAPERLLGLPGWVWLGVVGTAGCWVLL